MANLAIEKIEIVQTIQSASNDVPLIAGKLTYVRVYLSADSSISGLRIVGELSAKDGSGNVFDAIPSIEHTQLEPGLALHQQRLNWSKSLNFLLPEDFWNHMQYTTIDFELTKASGISPDGELVNFDKIEGKGKTIRVDFEKDPEMQCRIVIFRYEDTDNQNLLLPTKGEVEAIQHHVENIFPVASVNWSSVIISPPDEFRALESVSRNNEDTEEQTTRALVKLFNHLQVIRDQDILHGRDSRTLYLGLLSDPGGRLGGAAMDSPQFAAPHTVAITSTDSDGQLGAHEIAHALGCRHPGIPDLKLHGRYIGQRKETDSANDSVHGYLSEKLEPFSDEIHLGLDARYGTNTPAILPHDQWFDLMTYRHPQWISATTYSNLHHRLQDSRDSDYFEIKNSRYPQDLNKLTSNRSEWSWTIIGEYDLRHKTGRIHYLGPTRYQTPTPQSIDKVELKLAWNVDESATRLAEVPIYIKDLEKLDGSSNIGVFQHTLTPALLAENHQNSFRRTVDNNKPLKLLIGELEVDEIGGQDIKSVSSAIDNLISQITSNSQRNETSLLKLNYSVDEDAYYIDYQWPENSVGDLQLMTSLACNQGKQTKNGRPEWETISLSKCLKNRAWISPKFLYNPQDKMSLEDAEEGAYGNSILKESQIMAQQLNIRIGFSTGFFTSFCTTTLTLSSIESLGNRDGGRSYLPYPGNPQEPETERCRYRDTGTN